MYFSRIVINCNNNNNKQSYNIWYFSWYRRRQYYLHTFFRIMCFSTTNLECIFRQFLSEQPSLTHWNESWSVCHLERVFKRCLFLAWLQSAPASVVVAFPLLSQQLVGGEWWRHYIFPSLFLIFPSVVLFFLYFLFFFNDIRLDVMVGRKYLTATVGEIRTCFFPLVARYSDANPSVRYGARSTFYTFFFTLSKYPMANIWRVTGKKVINIPLSVLFFSNNTSLRHVENDIYNFSNYLSCISVSLMCQVKKKCYII